MIKRNKYVAILLVITLFVFFSLVKVPVAEASGGKVEIIMTMLTWAAKLIVFLLAWVGLDWANRALAETQEKNDALEWMCKHPCEWRDRHPEWDLYEDELQELIDDGECRACVQ